MRRLRLAQRWLEPYLFVLPAFAGFGFLAIYPIAEAVDLSLRDASLLLGMSSDAPFVGLDYYRDLLGDPPSWSSLRVTVFYTVVCGGQPRDPRGLNSSEDPVTSVRTAQPQRAPPRADRGPSRYTRRRRPEDRTRCVSGSGRVSTQVRSRCSGVSWRSARCGQRRAVSTSSGNAVTTLRTESVTSVANAVVAHGSAGKQGRRHLQAARPVPLHEGRSFRWLAGDVADGAPGDEPAGKRGGER